MSGMEERKFGGRVTITSSSLCVVEHVLFSHEGGGGQHVCCPHGIGLGDPAIQLAQWLLCDLGSLWARRAPLMPVPPQTNSRRIRCDSLPGPQPPPGSAPAGGAS